MASKTEQIVKEKLMKEGWRTTQSGWPDFLCFRYDQEGEVELAVFEVKSKTDKVRRNQHKILSALSKVMPVFLIQETQDGKLVKEKYNAGTLIDSNLGWLFDMERDDITLAIQRREGTWFEEINNATTHS